MFTKSIRFAQICYPLNYIENKSNRYLEKANKNSGAVGHISQPLVKLSVLLSSNMQLDNLELQS
jgi:hypothetical protein